MTDFDSIDALNRSLIDEYSKSESRNEEFEESMLETLIREEKWDLILYCLDPSTGFLLNPVLRYKICATMNLELNQCLYQRNNSKLYPEQLLLMFNYIINQDRPPIFEWLSSMFTRDHGYEVVPKIMGLLSTELDVLFFMKHPDGINIIGSVYTRLVNVMGINPLSNLNC